MNFPVRLDGTHSRDKYASKSIFIEHKFELSNFFPTCVISISINMVCAAVIHSQPMPNEFVCVHVVYIMCSSRGVGKCVAILKLYE